MEDPATTTDLPCDCYTSFAIFLPCLEKSAADLTSPPEHLWLSAAKKGEIVLNLEFNYMWQKLRMGCCNEQLMGV